MTQPLPPLTINLNNEGYENLVKINVDGLNTLSLLVGGVHCAVCIQKIESSILKLPHIKEARLNFSTGRFNVKWEGSASLANQFVNIITSLGYSVNPYNPDIEKSTLDAENRFLLLCLGVAGFAMGNIMLLSVGLWTTTTETMGIATRELLHLVSGLIAIPAVMFSGRPFFRSAFSVLKKGQTNMDVPISLGLILACGMSIFEIFQHGEHTYFDSAVMLMFFLLIGRYMDFRARKNARSAATDLIKTLSGFATVIEDGKHQRILIRDLREGMTVLVGAGENIPVDSVIIDGQSAVDTSLITGETLPRDVGIGDMVFAGTINQSAPIKLTVSKAAEDSILADVVRLMEKAEQGQAKYVRLADRVARAYTPVVHILAILAFILWFGFLNASWQDALMIAVTVLIVTCPCALGLAVPVVQVLASGVLMKRGILVKSGDALERLAVIDTILFDKTGTLTIGKPELVGQYDESALAIAASLSSYSRHPLSRALSSAYQGEIIPITDITEQAGKGLKGLFQGKEVKLGGRSWCNIPHDINQTYDLEICFVQEDIPPIRFTFQDELKVDSKETIDKLKSSSLNLVLLSGDRKNVVDLISKQVGIDNALAEMTPIDKYNYLETLKKENHKVLMVGDGLNDAPVLAGADISMAPGTAIDMAQNAADIVFMGDKFLPVLTAYNIAVLTQKLVKQNFALSILYNFIAVPLAFMGLITPMLAALAMSLSSLIVIANSFRLRRYK
jgi:Cu2+-exporting ATPase